MTMNKTIIAALALIIIAAGTVFYFSRENAAVPEQSDNGTGEPQNGRVMSIDDYVRQNISTLSPEKEVLGGKFYVTRIETNKGSGYVEYEDGHIALAADFTYRIDQERGITITSFTIRK